MLLSPHISLRLSGLILQMHEQTVNLTGHVTVDHETGTHYVKLNSRSNGSHS